jgi:hypothetical protein
MERAQLLANLSLVAQGHGALDRAERLARESVAAHDRLGANPTLPLICLGMCLVLGERWADGREVLLRAIAEGAGWQRAQVDAQAQLACCLAGEGDWGAWDAAWATVERLVHHVACRDLEILAVARRAARMCAERGEPARAARAQRVADHVAALPSLLEGPHPG